MAMRPEPPPPEVVSEEALAPDQDDQPLPLRLWYPATSNSTLPLVLISHGTEDICADLAGFDREGFKAGFNRDVSGFFSKNLI